MKKFVVTFNKYHKQLSCEDIVDVLSKEEVPHFYKEDVTVTELPSIPEVKKIETGVLNVPDVFCVTHGTKLDRGRQITFNGGSVIDLNKYPDFKPLCKDIRTEWDFSSIPVGSLVEVVEYKNKRIGWLKDNEQEYLRLLYSEKDSFTVEKEWVKSIRIIEGGAK